MPDQAVRLSALGVGDAREAFEYVRTYFAHEGIEYTPAMEAGILELLGSFDLGRFYEIMVGDNPVGYIVLTFGFDHEVGGRLGLVTDFYLEEEERGRGVGGEVVRLIEEAAAGLGLKAIELVVLAHNPRGRAFYERHGFRASDGRTLMLKLL